MSAAQNDNTDEHVTLQQRTQSASTDITTLIRKRLQAFSEKHADCLADTDDDRAPRTSLTVNSTTSNILELETSKMSELKKVVNLDAYRENAASKQ